MSNEVPCWLQISLSNREQMRADHELKKFKECIEELTANPLDDQVMAENEYYAVENRIYYNRLSDNDTILIDIPPDNCRVLYRHALDLHESDRQYMTLYKFEDLQMLATDYEKFPPTPAQNSIPLDMEQRIVDIALENPLWGVPHIMTSMRNIGYWETKMHHVASALRRNHIPNSKRRSAKGISWEFLLPTLQFLLAEDDDFLDRFIHDRKIPYNPYAKPHEKLMKFIRTATISPQILALNRFLRVENTLLSGFYYREYKELHLSNDEKCLLAKPASTLSGINRHAVPLLTPKEIVTFCRKQAGQKYASKCPQKKLNQTEKEKRKKEKAKYKPLKDLSAYIESKVKKKEYETPEEAFADIEKEFGPKVEKHRVLDCLRISGFFKMKQKANGITWEEFKSGFADVTWAGDFFSVDVFTKYGILTYQVLFFVHLGSGEVFIAGASHHATSDWVISQIKQLTDAESPFGPTARFLIRDCDRRYTKEVDWYFTSIGLLPKKITPDAPVMNCQAEIFVRQIKQECLNHLPIFSEHQLKKLLECYAKYYNTQRPNVRAKGGYIQKSDRNWQYEGKIVMESLLPGILNYYYREAA